MEKQKEFGSNFVSRGALLFLLALVVITSYYQMGGLPAFLLLVFLLAAVSLAWGKGSLKHLEISIEGKSLNGFPGEEIEFVLAAANEKQVVFGRLQLIANGHALHIAVNAPPFQALFEARDIAPVSVKVQNIGIEMANIQFHNYASQYSLNP